MAKLSPEEMRKYLGELGVGPDLPPDHRLYKSGPIIFFVPPKDGDKPPATADQASPEKESSDDEAESAPEPREEG